ncbi:hypothetical protein JEM51_11560 [Ligilactobacillus agilis]|uniref:beta-1,6-N-acetylglucosaminyltransferase n=1 Tax=Ligilactobacillus agilis TaxID=1601 RepID=UPI00191E556E|nr:beta-1,6-N-acetylglucosaminyltransferase [Ligilactobacillus agilis]MBL1057030.1 hypothetical protein [Ligilactobacillus agilis]
MKHAIMVIGHGDTCEVLQETVKILDSNSIDFYIHWDAKYIPPKIYSNYSKIEFIDNPESVFWGTDTQIKAEYLLFNAVAKADIDYDYVHLISAMDIPLMDKRHFLSFFEKQGRGKAYVDYFPVNSWDYYRISYYYPFSHIKLRGSVLGSIYKKVVPLVNRMFFINRVKNKKIYKGTNWFSLDSKYLNYILDFKNPNMFMNSYLADELLIQTILYNEINTFCQPSLRYIDWKRGAPYTFGLNDILELSRLINTEYLFARKVNNSKLVDELYKNY